jgi:hypothetical protein
MNASVDFRNIPSVPSAPAGPRRDEDPIRYSIYFGIAIAAFIVGAKFTG